MLKHTLPDFLAGMDMDAVVVSLIFSGLVIAEHFQAVGQPSRKKIYMTGCMGKRVFPPLKSRMKPWSGCLGLPLL